MLERVFKEVKRRTRVTGVFLNETGAQTLATEIVLRSSEKKWTLKPYLTMDALKRIEDRYPTTFETLTSKRQRLLFRIGAG